MDIEPGHLRLLAGLLAAPQEDSLEVLRELSGEQEWLRQAVGEIEEMPLDRWQGEHTRLFISGYPKTVCPPFESAYRYGGMSGSGDEELLGIYLRMGRAPQDMPPDYLGVLLEGAAELLEGSASLAATLATVPSPSLQEGGLPASRQGTGRERAVGPAPPLEASPQRGEESERIPALWHALWQEHLVTWVPRFARDMLEGSRMVLYQALGKQFLALFPEVEGERQESGSTTPFPPAR
jgi:TorA maturation chaperone TorD